MNVNDLVRDVQNLVAKYGQDNVLRTLNFLNDLPNVHNVRWVAPSGYVVDLTSDQVAMLRGVYNNGANKITAIKELHNLTGCRLVDAKQLIEYYFENRRDF